MMDNNENKKWYNFIHSPLLIAVVASSLVVTAYSAYQKDGLYSYYEYDYKEPVLTLAMRGLADGATPLYVTDDYIEMVQSHDYEYYPGDTRNNTMAGGKLDNAGPGDGGNDSIIASNDRSDDGGLADDTSSNDSSKTGEDSKKYGSSSSKSSESGSGNGDSESESSSKGAGAGSTKESAGSSSSNEGSENADTAKSTDGSSTDSGKGADSSGNQNGNSSEAVSSASGSSGAVSSSTAGSDSVASGSGTAASGSNTGASGSDASNAAVSASSAAGSGSSEAALKEYPYMTTTGVVDADYFADALFIGDSRTVGLSEYCAELDDKATFYGKVSLSIYEANNKAFVKSGGSKLTLEQALEGKDFKKVYIMVGINEIGYGTTEGWLGNYIEVIGKIQNACPDAIIYLQAIMHVTREYDNTKAPDASINGVINERSEALKTLADNRRIFYLNINEILDDENGDLIADISFDGVHLKASAYTVWYEYLRTHVAEVPKNNGNAAPDEKDGGDT